MKATVYLIATGEILRVVTAPDSMIAIQASKSTEAFLIGESNDVADWVNQGEIQARPVQSTAIDKATIQANDIDAVTIINPPTGAELTVKNLTTGDTATAAISGSDTFTTAIAGQIQITVTKWPYLDWTATIEAI